MVPRPRTIVTEHLILRPFEDADVDALFAVLGNAAAMRYTHVATSREECRHRLRAFAALESALGFAPWTVRQRADERIVGWGGLGIDPFEPGWGVEVSYFFDPTAWGRGYATELVRASLGHGFGALHLPLVHAFARPENLASIRVLEKCGFVWLGYEPSLERNHYEARDPSCPTREAS